MAGFNVLEQSLPHATQLIVLQITITITIQLQITVVMLCGLVKILAKQFLQF